MYQVSEALDKVISGSGRTFYARLNGISDGIQEIVQTNFSTPDSYFYVGGAIASKIEASMFTKTQEFVKGTEVRFEIGAMADGAIEWIPMGYFTIKEQKKDRNLLTFTAYDRLESKLAKAYKSKITKYPVESKEFLADISEQTGVEFDTSKLSDSLMIDKILTVNDQSGEKTYKEPFDGFTMQQVVGYIAQLHGTFAICDRNGKVTFKWYEALTTDYPGKIGDTAGSYLKDQNLSFIYNTIEFLKESHTYLIKTNRYFDDLLQSETMCQISGISCDTENDHYESGTNINTNLSNPVMTQEWLNKILKKIKDMSYYPVSFSFMGDPRLDVGDVVTIVDAKNNLIDVPVMQHTITFDGGLLSEVASYGFEEKEVKSPSEIALQRVKDDVLSLQEITAKKATFNQLNAVDAKITNLQASAITTNTANILYARLDKANIEYGWITTVMIGDAQITDAKIQGLTASKLTAGTIDASNINVLNLNASNITVGKINGKQLSDEINNNITNSLNNSNNALSTANNAIQVVKIEYYSSTSKNETTGGSWTENTPEWIEGRYIWSRTKTITKIGGVAYSDEACITGNTGAKGDKGDQGVQGVKGADGKTYYTWVKYADSATSGMSDNPSGKKYIGFAYNKSTVTESTNYSDYAWSLIKGDTGPQGVKGDTGATGNGIKSITYYYAKTTTQTAPSASSVTATAMPQLDATNKYLWQKEVITYTNNQTQTSVLLLAVYGNTGAKGDKGDQGVQGKGVKSIKGQYYLSSSKTSLVGGTWSDTQPTWTEGSYIWTRSYIVWSDDTITTTTPILANALNAANSVANTALSTADGKNAVFYQASQPSTAGRKTNDVWYDTGNENAMYYFNGKSWVKKEFGNNALDNISASKITTGTLDAKKVTLINLDASSITTGTITGLDALFNKSFKVNSPISNNLNFMINADASGFSVGVSDTSSGAKEYKALVGFDIAGTMVIETKGYLRVSGGSRLSLVSKKDIVLYPKMEDGGNVYINNGTTNNVVLHDGNATSSSAFDDGVEIGTIELGTSATTLKVPLASYTQAGLITATEKLKINTDYLPLTGGIIKSSNINVLGLDWTSGAASTLRFYGSGTRLGSLGFTGQNSKACRWDASGNAYQLLDDEDLKDSGWVNITVTSGLSVIDWTGARVRKIGNMVNVVMGVTGVTTGYKTIGTLSTAYRPPKMVNIAARYGNSPDAQIAITAEGNIMVMARTSGNTNYDPSTAICFSTTYFV